MKIIASRSVQLNGHIYSKGEIAEWNGPIDSRIAALFTAEDGSSLTATPTHGKDKTKTPQPEGDAAAERIEKLVKDLGQKGITQKLDDLGVPYPPKMAVAQLALLLLQQQGEV